MNKRQLLEELSKSFGCSKGMSREILDTFTDTFTKLLREGKTISIPGFGKFEVLKRRAKEAINPRTGARITVPEYHTPAFKAGSVLKKAVKDNFDK